jgi:uncharacterized Ntn-hydrolase superfamily protein
MTFSISARDPDTGMFGVAVSTAIMCVGALCPFPRAGVGAVSTQSFVNPYIGLKAGEYLATGMDAASAVARLAEEDEGRDIRQFALVDRAGRSAAYSGKSCVGWFGHLTGENFAVAGNMLVGEPTIVAMAESFAATTGPGVPLGERLVRALEAGQAAGGDKRGRMSAALKVVHTEDYPLVDLRVDEHAQPVAELRRLWDLYPGNVGAFMPMLPSKAHPAGQFNLDEIRNLLPERDG